MKKNKNILIGIVLIGVIILLLLGIIFGQRIYKISKMEKTARKYAELGEYDDAIDAYNKLILKSDNDKYIDEISRIKKLKQSFESFTDGKKQYDNGNYPKAASLLEEVLKDDEENYNKAKKMLDSISVEYTAAIEASLEDMNFEEAESKLGEHSKIFNDQEMVAAYKKKIEDSKKAQKEEEEKQKEQEELALAKDELEKLKNQVKENNTRNNTTYIYSNSGFVNYVTSDKANIRSGPSIDSPVITYVSRGSTVQIYETIQDVGRTWCHAIITSSVTGNSYDGWISSRNLDYSL